MSQLNLPFGLPMPGGPLDRPVTLPEMPGFGAPHDPDAPPAGMKMPAPTCEFLPQVAVTDDGVAIRSEAVVLGTPGEKEADGIVMTCQEPCINGFYVNGDNCYTVRNSTIRFEGDGLNDFAGIGAGVQVADNATVTLENTRIETSGVIRPCTFAGDYTTLIVKNCQLIGNGGVVPPGTPPVVGPGMKEPPVGLGIGGNCRTHLSAGDSHAYFYDSLIYADGWAALSTDACFGDMYLEANNCDVVVKNVGYATYSDHGGNVVVNDSRLSATIAAIIAGKCREVMKNCTVKAGKYLAMIHSVFGNPHEVSEFSVAGGTVETDLECILVKSQNAYIDLRGVEMTSKTGCLIHSVLNDDPCATKVAENEDPYGVKACLSDMTLQGDILHEDPQRTMALHFKHTKLTGGIQNAIVCLDAASLWTADKDSKVFITGFGPRGRIDALPGVTITAKSDKLPSGTTVLPSGGKLVVD